MISKEKKTFFVILEANSHKHACLVTCTGTALLHGSCIHVAANVAQMSRILIICRTFETTFSFFVRYAYERSRLKFCGGFCFHLVH